MFYGIASALTQKFGWTDGVNKLYQTLSNDFLYNDANKNVIFLDNHDMTRFLSTVNDDVDKLKMGMMWLLTCRGIPQLYYGTEILMNGVSNTDGWVRLDFKGGWEGDVPNKFTKEGRSEQEEEVFALNRRLGNFRKNASAIKTGKFMQYIPDNGLYVYFRYDAKQTVMCVMNTGDKLMQVKFSKNSERTTGFSRATSVIENKEYETTGIATIAAKSMGVPELKK